MAEKEKIAKILSPKLAQMEFQKISIVKHFGQMLELAEYLIENGATIPVRCKDCKHRRVAWNNGKHMCHNPYYGMASGVELKDDDFCSYGERKDK